VNIDWVSGSRAIPARRGCFDSGVSGPRIGNVRFASFPLFGKLSCCALRDPLQVPSEVNV